MLNTITIAGRITKEPELRKTQNGKSVMNITLACERDYREQDGTKKTDFIEVMTWGASADFIDRYLHKGDTAIATGRLQIDKFEDRNGVNREKAKINASNVYAAGSPQKAQQSTYSTYNEQTYTAPQEPAYNEPYEPEYETPWDDSDWPL